MLLIDISIFNDSANFIATTITHIGIESHDPMAPSDGCQTSIFGKLGTRRLGTVISTISSVV
jgi:hypothetical protein